MNTIKMVSRIWTKPATQQAIKALRSAGIEVKKINSGYEAKSKQDVLLFKAMIGSRGYLVRHRSDLFV